MLKIRLTRLGAKKAPYYRIVVADSRAPREGRQLTQSVLTTQLNPQLWFPSMKKKLSLGWVKVRNLQTQYVLC